MSVFSYPRKPGGSGLLLKYLPERLNKDKEMCVRSQVYIQRETKQEGQKKKKIARTKQIITEAHWIRAFHEMGY